MTQSITVRDVVRKARYERGPDEEALRVPYDLFNPVGAVHKEGDLIDWKQGDDTVHTGRAVPELLKNTHPGERVLLRLESTADSEWWLCEIEAVDGVAGGKDG